MVDGMSSRVEAVMEMDLGLGAKDWKPTPHGHLLAKVLSDQDLVRGKRVLELGAGVGNHTIVMARKGAARIVATEILPELTKTTEANVRRNVGDGAPVEYRVADWMNVNGTYDLVVTNPPFCRSGKQNRRYFLDSLILDAHKRLEGQGGQVIFVQSSMADVELSKGMLDRNGFEPEVLATSRHPFRDYYYEDPTFLAEMERVPGAYELEGDTRFETLSVLRGTLRAYEPPAGAHVFV